VHYRWEALAGGVHRCRLPFLDVSVGLAVGPDAVLLIDCGTTLSEAERLADDIIELAGRPVNDIVLTHHHFDHILGSAAFPDARLHCAAPVTVALTSGVDALREHAVGYGAEPDEVDRTVARLRAPDHVVSNTLIHLGDRAVQVEHPGRGHTDHDLAVIVPPRNPAEPPVVFCGDLIEESADPAADEGSDLAAWPVTVDRLLELGGPAAVYVPGHGAVVGAGFLAEQRDWLRRSATRH
jgi:glyoxylase-like metal-dependent hydrolase (beta-lactamase superfamily II)